MRIPTAWSALLLALLATIWLGYATGPLAQEPASAKTANADAEAEAEAQRLLAEQERRRGPTSPGLDPAFLVLPRAPQASEMARELLTDDVVQMSQQALDFIAAQQDPDGGWSDTQFASNTGVTALCCLSLMAEGSRPRAGRYGRQLDRGLEFLLKNVQASGAIAGKGSNPYGPGYEHALSTLALVLAYGDMPWRPELRDVISQAVQLLLRSQRLDGGWRYQLSREGHSDMSVTANVLWVLRTAKKAGFTVPREAIGQGVAFVEKCALPDGHFRYRAFGIEAAPSLGGTGVIALSNNGQLDHPLIAPARDKIVYEYGRYTIADLQERRYFVFGCFYASLAVYSCGDEYWIPWFKKASTVLAAMQRTDGDFPDQLDNHVYPTAMAAMVLLAPRGYLPLYER
ncbi:prenyltransferase/squalene oxidase repeat-containing protein [Lignipirellula cremea]|uniref:Prenyltransferase and squalene oxidase repeat protein n=1 Tax=Lignipirellula cremea TaxID=2528010 RepID=A0A518DWC9_9BACT|nr:prenyltransferase/squalene oxidase repeat-containing protein [Lignipirellula cremea]QDU96137.1 Prenyltransferase and squalene oxidase repeat protein [Lignipirellula cremea]